MIRDAHSNNNHNHLNPNAMLNDNNALSRGHNSHNTNSSGLVNYSHHTHHTHQNKDNSTIIDESEPHRA